MKLKCIFVVACLLSPMFASAAVYDCRVVSNNTTIGEMRLDTRTQEPAAVALSSDHYAICTGTDANGIDLLVCGQVNLNAKQRIFYGGHQILNLNTDILSLAAAPADAGLLLAEGYIDILKATFTTVCTQ